MRYFRKNALTTGGLCAALLAALVLLILPLTVSASPEGEDQRVIDADHNLVQALAKPDNRLLIAAGFATLAVATFLLGDINLEIGTASIVWPNVLSGLATGFIFVPLTTMAMGSLRDEEIGTATGIFNLMRNIGGSVGISAVATMLARGAQTHQALMVGNLSASHRAFGEELAQLRQALAQHVGAPAAARMAYGLMYQTLLQQAALWAYVDTFRLLALLCLLCVSLVLLFRRVHAGSSSPAVH